MDTPIKNIAVIFGGNSPEYAVSLESAHAVINHIDRSKYRPVLIGISRAGEWFYYSGEVSRIQSDTWLGADCTPAVVSPDPTRRCLLVLEDSALRPIPLDAALPILHGKNGEDGTVQGVFELAGIPIAGCGLLASALCMDKSRAHTVAQAAGVLAAHSVVLCHGDGDSAAALAEGMHYPLFVKPMKAGSSYGITRITRPDELACAIALAFTYDDTIIIEENVPGFEVGCALMERSGKLVIGEVDEIELSDGFFDFTEKYTLKTSAIHVPARISPETVRRVKETAAVIYRALDCRGFARVDMFLTPAGEIVFNEVNTIPGFTAHSRFPSMMRAAGISFSEIISTVIGEALQS